MSKVPDQTLRREPDSATLRILILDGPPLPSSEPIGLYKIYSCFLEGPLISEGGSGSGRPAPPGGMSNPGRFGCFEACTIEYGLYLNC